MSELPPDKAESRKRHIKTFIMDSKYIINMEFRPNLSALRLPPEMIQLLLIEIKKMNEHPELYPELKDEFEGEGDQI